MGQWYLLFWLPDRFVPSRRADGQVKGRQVYHGIHVSCTLDRRYQSRCRSPSRSLDTNAAAVFSLMWGAILMLTAACHNASGLLAVRFFLGIAESLIAPGLTIMISMFYKRSEQPLRHAAWFLGNTIAGALSGLLNYSIGHITSITPWKVSGDICRQANLYYFVADNLR